VSDWDSSSSSSTTWDDDGWGPSGSDDPATGHSSAGREAWDAAGARGPADPPEIAKSSSRRSHLSGGVLAAIIGAVGAVAAAVVTAVITLVGEKDPAPATLLADISAVNPVSGTPCCGFTVQVDVQGFDGRVCTVEGYTVDAYSGEHVLRAGQEVRFEADRDRASTAILVQAPSGWYAFSFVIRDDRGTELDRVQTAPVLVG
jgi:hypothetical protein